MGKVNTNLRAKNAIWKRFPRLPVPVRVCGMFMYFSLVVFVHNTNQHCLKVVRTAADAAAVLFILRICFNLFRNTNRAHSLSLWHTPFLALSLSDPHTPFLSHTLIKHETL